MTLDEKQGDLYEVQESKTEIKELILAKLKAHSEYAGYTDQEAVEYIDDFLGECFATSELEEEIEQMEEAQDVQDAEELRQDFYRSVL